MNLTIVCDVLGEENNGTTIAAMNLIRALRAHGHTVQILCPDAGKQDLPGHFVVPTRNLGPFNGYVRRNGVSLARRDDAVIRKAIAGADIVHVMMPFTLGRRAAFLAHQAGIPVSAGFHVMAENFTTHVFLMNSPVANRLTYRFFSRTYRCCDAIHYPTQFLRELYEGICGKNNGYVISNGVNAMFRPCPSRKPQAYADKFVIVSTGRYSREKAQSRLIDAVALSRFREQIQLIFPGSGPLEQALKKRASVLPVAPVFSFFPHGEMVSILNYADLYVHPAEIEAEGIACLEAISCGVVPVISDSPRCATREYALSEQNLFRYDSAQALAQKIDWWLSHPQQRRECSRQYISYAAKRFDQQQCMAQMEAMLLETARRGKRL